MSLSERLRPDVEAAPWVIEEVTVLEAEIEALHEQVQDMIERSGQECGCGYDKPGDVCLGHWPKYKKQQDKIERLRNFVQIVIDQGGLLSDDQFEEMKNVLEEG